MSMVLLGSSWLPMFYTLSVIVWTWMYPAVDSIIRVMIALAKPHVWDLTSAVIEPILRN
jgi:hypothetical protein